MGQSEGATALGLRFEAFGRECWDFSRAIVEGVAPSKALSPDGHARANLAIARTVFGKWSLEILAVLYGRGGASFQQVRKALGPISSRVLSTKLRRMEELGLVARQVLSTRPPRTQYTLTERGLLVARLGEPVFLYLRFAQGLLEPNHTE